MPCLARTREILHVFLIFSLGFTAFVFPPIALLAESRAGNTMIIFDASGSMWGQIEGRTKIEIAREAFTKSQSAWDSAGGRTGLIAYGHRRKGDCGDIETIVPLDARTGGAITNHVQSLRPKGKTPLSDAVRLAAEQLRYQEEAATVILFSDGIETCRSDPCALARELEQDGINFTAHVIGFGIGNDADREQLACIAENTGGRYFDADNADALSDALTQVAQAPPAAPEAEPTALVPLRLTVQEAEGTARPDQVSFRATDADTGERRFLGTLTHTAEVMSGLQTELPHGAWVIEALSKEGGGEISVQVTADLESVDVPFQANATSFVFLDNSPYRMGIEHSFYIGVTDPLQANADYTVALYPAGATEFDQRIDWETRFGGDATGFTEHDFVAPDIPGDYEIIILRGRDLNQADARFLISYESDAPIEWRGEIRGDPGAELPIRISGDFYRNNTLTLRDSSGQDITRERVQYLFRNEDNQEINGSIYKIATGPTLKLPDKAGEYGLFYETWSEDSETHLGTIVVGTAILEDDPDAVEPPREQNQAAPSTQAPASTDSNVPTRVLTSETSVGIRGKAEVLNGLWVLRHRDTGQVLAEFIVKDQSLRLKSVRTDAALKDQQQVSAAVATDDTLMVALVNASQFTTNLALTRDLPEEYHGDLLIAGATSVVPVVLVQIDDLTGLDADAHGAEDSIQTASNVDPVLQRKEEIADAVFACKSIQTCHFDDPVTGLTGIPVLPGFALLQPIVAEENNLVQLDLLHIASGEWAQTNPDQQSDMVTECVTVGLIGHHAEPGETGSDLICGVVGAGGEVASMVETLIFWMTERHERALDHTHETRAIGGEDSSGTPAGVLQGNWELRDRASGAVLLKSQIFHDQGAENAEGDLVRLEPGLVGQGSRGYDPLLVSIQYGADGAPAALTLIFAVPDSRGNAILQPDSGGNWQGLLTGLESQPLINIELIKVAD